MTHPAVLQAESAPPDAPHPGAPLNRMLIAALALAGVFISAYLLLFSLGVVGTLACGEAGGCSRVQASEYAVFLGLPVPAWGLGGYSLLLLVALAGVQERWQSARAAGLLILLLATVGFAFTLYLTWLEAFVIHAWCRWCLASAAIATVIFLCALLEVRRLRGGAVEL